VFVETIFATSKGEHYGVLGSAEGNLLEIIPFALSAVAASDQKEVLDLALLHRIYNLIRYRENCIAPKSGHREGLIVILNKSCATLGMINQLGEIIVR